MPGVYLNLITAVAAAGIHCLMGSLGVCTTHKFQFNKVVVTLAFFQVAHGCNPN